MCTLTSVVVGRRSKRGANAFSSSERLSLVVPNDCCLPPVEASI